MTVITLSTKKRERWGHFVSAVISSSKKRGGRGREEQGVVVIITSLTKYNAIPTTES